MSDELKPTRYDIELLRYLNDEIDGNDMVFGACTNTCATWLKNQGYTHTWGGKPTIKGLKLLEKYKGIALEDIR
jgi:hypothetical protein